MDPALARALAACDAPIDQAATLPPVCYTDPAIAEAELHIFRTSWLGIGRSDMVAEANDFCTLELAGHSIILVRDPAGELRALSNSCRHRGARLLDGEGSCRAIRCPFHSWAYMLDGSLVAAPNMKDVPGFDQDSFGLVTYRVEERLGFVLPLS